MFEQACERAVRFTCPYVGLRRKHDGTVFSTVAAFIVVNDEGWCMTAKHVFDEIDRAQQSIAGSAAIEEELKTLRSPKSGDSKHRARQTHLLERQKADSLSDRVEIWAGGEDWMQSHPRATDPRVHPVADLVVFRLEPFAAGANQGYPVFRSAEIKPGLSVCRIGFPWHAVEADFANGNFDVKSGFPAPLFVLDGVVSRFAVEERPDGSKATYIQTSTPGLRGQSGGPLFDAAGRLCGLQSSTTHLDLGFDARYEQEGRTMVERQFLNVGQAVHVRDIVDFLDLQGIAYARS